MNSKFNDAIRDYDEFIALQKLYSFNNVKEDTSFQRLFKKHFGIKVDEGAFDYCFFQLLEENKGEEIWFDKVQLLFEELASLNINFNVKESLKIASSLLYFSRPDNRHYLNEKTLKKLHLTIENFKEQKEIMLEVGNSYIMFHKAFLEIINDEGFISYKEALEERVNEPIQDTMVFDLLLKYLDKENFEKIYENKKEGYMWLVPENKRF